MGGLTETHVQVYTNVCKKIPYVKLKFQNARPQSLMKREEGNVKRKSLPLNNLVS